MHLLAVVSKHFMGRGEDTKKPLTNGCLGCSITITYSLKIYLPGAKNDLRMEYSLTNSINSILLSEPEG
jgi:hypothetical protein